ncbi:MAG: threonine synthase, partial [Thermotogaceae bacterium]|nr:threonine synthase [Thermotogaceae bacterium]
MRYKLRCITCGTVYDPDEVEYTCPKCGDRLGTLEVVYDYDEIKVSREEFSKDADMFQFEKLLPLEKNYYKVPLKVGGTPLYEFPNKAEELGINRFFVKYDGVNPTASYKDRASAVAIAKAVEKGYNTIYAASTGNAASSLAGLTAPTHLKSVIFVPAKAPRPKIMQIKIFGAKLVPIDADYDTVFDLSMKVGEKMGWYCRNSAINPYLLEGKKTGGMEIAVQMNFDVPDYVLAGVGDGTVISGIYKGLYDMYRVGLIEKVPKIIGVQAEGAAAVKAAFDAGEPFKPHDSKANTLADSIAVGKPRDVIKACKYVKASGGYYVAVSDKEILEAGVELASDMGLFSEPAG